MGKGGRAPAPPDPYEVGAAQTGTNVATAVANANLGNVNQITPDGSLTYTQSGTSTFTDPTTGQTYEIPQYTATQALSEGGQAVYDQNQRADLNMATLAADQSGFLNEYMAEPFSYNPGAHEEWAGGLYEQLNGDSMARQQEAMRTQMVNQGLTPGSQAYDDSMRGMYSGQQDARNRFMLDSYGQGMQTALTQRNQPINEITALLSGSQVSQPNFVNTSMPSIATTDMAGLINNNYNQRLNNFNADQQRKAGLMGGLFDLGGSLGSAAIMASDRRLKADIERIAEINGMGVYRFRYLGSADPQVGLMADEVEQVKPGAVIRGVDGYASVNYEEALS